ncbi:MAG: hypothetical protein KJ606_05745 [Chloroflexi bacterium]|nr:hypothetical protein [Chloroflexota bacterium]
MAEQTARKNKPFEGKIPEDVREHAKAAHKEMHASFEALFPPEFMEHHRKARKEMLLACRSMLDTVINRMEEHEKKARPA